MAYPPPPGTSNSSSRSNTNSPHPSLPARPPPQTGSGGGSSGFKSAFKQAFTPPQVAASATSYGAPPTRAPAHYGAAPSYSSYSQPPSSVSSAPYQYPQQTNYQSSDYNAPPTASYGAAPQIRNPFPLPGTAQASHGPGGSSFDPEMAAQIAQWQSAYGSNKDSAAGSAPITAGPAAGPATTSHTPDASSAAGPQDPNNKKTVIREGGGKKWTDDTLLEWDPSHLRLFVGNLAGEVTDDSLLKAFSRWTSVQKARVIRDKRTSKSKGYGFVAFSDADDFFQAAKEMNGKYIQSHPVVVRKANTEIKVASNKNHGKGGKYDKKNKNKNKSGSGGGGGGGAGGGAGYEPGLGPVHHGGVTKPGQKTKNGLKLLG